MSDAEPSSSTEQEKICMRCKTELETSMIEEVVDEKQIANGDEESNGDQDDSVDKVEIQGDLWH